MYSIYVIFLCILAGASIVPANQAGAGVFNCPDDYIVVSGVRLCGERLNDATSNIDFTVNAPVTGKQIKNNQLSFN
jgi:hypothetical protein